MRALAGQTPVDKDELELLIQKKVRELQRDETETETEYLSTSPSTSMYASLSRGGSRIRNPYICSSCLSGLLAHSDPQFARLAANRILQAAPFSTTRHNGNPKGKEDGDDASKPSAEAEMGPTAVEMLKTLEKSSKDVLERFKALTSSETTAQRGTEEGVKIGEAGTWPKMSPTLRKRLKIKGLQAKDFVGKDPIIINELIKAHSDAHKLARKLSLEGLKKNKKAMRAPKSNEGKEQATESTDPTGHENNANQEQELMEAISILLTKLKSKHTAPERGRKKGEAAVKPSPPAQPQKAVKTAAPNKGKQGTKKAGKPAGNASPGSVVKIEDQVSKLGEGEARNALISAIQGKAKKQPSDQNQDKDQPKKADQGTVKNVKTKAKKQPSDTAQDEVLKNLQESVTSKLPPKSPAKSPDKFKSPSKPTANPTIKAPAKSTAKTPAKPSVKLSRSSKKITQTIKAAMLQKPSLRKNPARPHKPNTVRMVIPNIVRMVKVPDANGQTFQQTRRDRNLERMAATEVETISATDLELVPINEGELEVPSLSYGLERVLFNPGVYQLQDPRSRVFNFDPYLQTIMPVSEFDFTLLKKFITSSRDTALLSTAKAQGKKYTGSTSSMTSALSHFHYLLSQWRTINPGVLSRNFPVDFDSFTQLQRAPTAMFLRYKDGTYAIDADKEYDTANVLSMLGQSMEKLLTLSTEEFEQYRKHSGDPPSEEARNKSEAYHYTTMGDFLMRSQLDAHDPRIPGTGMFDLKTRAVVSIRMDTAEYEHGSGYEIRSRHGEWESYEREYYDMIRAAFLKYSLQVRMGRMDGIFVAFHNTERIFGFQYISLPEMDYALHGSDDTTTGDSEFKLSLSLLNRVLDRATTEFPEQSLRLFFETRARTTEEETPYMYIFAEPVDEKTIEEIQTSNKDKIEEFERTVLGIPAESEAEKKSQWESLQAQVKADIEKDGDSQGEALEDKEGEIEDDDVSREIEDEIDRDHHADMEELTPDTEHVLSEEVIDEDAMNDEQENEVEEEPREVEEREEQALESEEEVQETAVDEEFVDEGLVVEDQDYETEDGSSEVEEQAEEVLETEDNDQGTVVDEDSDIEDEEKGAEDKSSELEEQAEEVLESEDNGKDQGVNEDFFTHPDDRVEPEFTKIPEQTTGGKGSQTAKDAQATEDEFARRPILGMYLTIRNKVNGRYVKRTSDLTKDDDWKVEYALANIPDQIKAHKLQQTSKLRRAKALTKNRQDANNAWNQRYIENIRRISSKGRAWRRKLDEKEKELPRKILDGVVFGRESKDPASLGKVNLEVWTEDGKKDE